MPITFPCPDCEKDIKAPDAAAGKKGKCPHCGQRVDIPAQPGEDDGDELIPLAPIDEEEEKRRQDEIHDLFEREKALLGEMGGPDAEPVPLEHREDLTPEDLHHYVINYCLAMANGKLEQAEQQAIELRKYGHTGMAAVNEFLEGEADEPALKDVPPPVLEQFLRGLLDKVS